MIGLYSIRMCSRPCMHYLSHHQHQPTKFRDSDCNCLSGSVLVFFMCLSINVPIYQRRRCTSTNASYKHNCNIHSRIYLLLYTISPLYAATTSTSRSMSETMWKETVRAASDTDTPVFCSHVIVDAFPSDKRL